MQLCDLSYTDLYKVQHPACCSTKLLQLWLKEAAYGCEACETAEDLPAGGLGCVCSSAGSVSIGLCRVEEKLGTAA